MGGVDIVWRAYDANDEEVPISQRGEFQPILPGVFTVTAEAGSQRAQTTVTVREDQAAPVLPETSTALPPEKSEWNEKNVSTAFKPGNRRGSSVHGQLRARREMLLKAEEAAAVGNRNLQLKVPVLRLPGRGLELALDLTYNSRLWQRADQLIHFDIDADWPAPGWSLGFGKLVFWRVPNAYEGMLIDADGTRHPYSVVRTIESTEGSEKIAHTTDGDLIDYSITWETGGSPTSGRVSYSNGTVVDFGAIGKQALYPTRITDANGNYITIAYRNNTGPEIAAVTDTLGRTISFHYDTQNLLTAVTGPGLAPETGSSEPQPCVSTSRQKVSTRAFHSSGTS